MCSKKLEDVAKEEDDPSSDPEPEKDVEEDPISEEDEEMEDLADEKMEDEDEDLLDYGGIEITREEKKAAVWTIIDETIEKVKEEDPELSEDDVFKEPCFSQYTMEALLTTLGYHLTMVAALKKTPLYKTLRQESISYQDEGMDHWEANQAALVKRKFFVMEKLTEQVEEATPPENMKDILETLSFEM